MCTTGFNGRAKSRIVLLIAVRAEAWSYGQAASESTVITVGTIGRASAYRHIT